MRTGLTSARRQFASVVVISLTISMIYWPALRSFFVLDDFFLIAICRLVDNPLTFFANNHMPGGFFYRPLTLLFWWLSVEIFGSATRAQYILNLILHIGVSIALWRLLYRFARARGVALMASVMFAVHPIGIGTALWLSDRFDLLAALFGLLAIYAALQYREQATRQHLAGAFAFALSSALSKEIGFAAFAAIALIWIWPTVRLPGNRTHWWTSSRLAATAIALVAVITLLWRSLILGSTLQPQVFATTPLWQIVVDGTARWSINFFYYVSQTARLANGARLSTAVGMIGLCGCILVATWLGLRRADWRSSTFILATTALALMLATAVLQAPTLGRTPVTLHADDVAVAIAANSRFFYLSLIAFTLLIASLLAIGNEALTPSRAHRLSMAAGFFALLCLVPWALGANHLARDYRRQSFAERELVRSALRASAALSLSQRHCQVYFLGLDDLIFGTNIDAALKALTPDVARVQNCMFQVEYTPWFYILKRSDERSSTPMLPVNANGKAAPSQFYGGVEIRFLNLQADIDATRMSDAHFLNLRRRADGAAEFVDVTADVLAGIIPVRFRCIRNARQCSVPEK